jgi:hypothetical protein
MENPRFLALDPLKQELIRSAARQTSGKTGRDLAPVMLTIIMNANKKGIQFTTDEFGLIMDLFKDGKNDTEKEQIDRTVEMAKNIFKKNTRRD